MRDHAELHAAKRAGSNCCDVAATALQGLSEKDRIHFALKIMLDTVTPEAVAPLAFAARRISEQSMILMREAYEAECG